MKWESWGINFAFKFNEEKFYFARNTEDASKVWSCDNNYHRQYSMTLESFCEFLKENYSLENINSTFRNIVNGYLRIYGKNNYNELFPLSAYKNESMGDGITRLLQLYGFDKELTQIEKDVKETEEKINLYKKSHKHNLIIGVSTQKEFLENNKRIEELEEEMYRLEENNKKSLNDVDSIKADKIANIKQKLIPLRRQRSRLESNKRAMEIDAELDNSIISKDFKELEVFFPNANIKLISEI